MVMSITKIDCALMSRLRLTLLTLFAMTAFAGNSLLCRMALKHSGIDPASFTTIRIVSGAITLWLIVRVRGGTSGLLGNWPSALALFVYAAAFSFAYVSLSAGTGALLLFGAVQATMIGYSSWAGNRLAAPQKLGLLVALGGLVGLMLPGLSAPALNGSLLMVAAGVSWGVYSLHGRGGGDPLRVTAGNFMRAVVPAAFVSVATLPAVSLDLSGVGFAVASGALASGVGYAIWYTALPGLKVTSAATIQLSVPVIAAMAGIVFLNEELSLRLFIASCAILGGIALVVVQRRRS